MPLLKRAADENWNVNKLRIAVRHLQWWTEPTGGDIIDDLNDVSDKKKWRGILAILLGNGIVQAAARCDDGTLSHHATG